MKKAYSKILKFKFPFSCRGFTIPELLVVITVIAIIFIIGIAAFTRFNRRQIVEQATKNLESDLRLAQGKAVAQEKPAGWCDGPGETLVGYRLRFVSPTRYIIERVCSDSSQNETIKTVDLPESVTGVQDTDVLFKVLSKGIDEPEIFFITGYGTIQGEVAVEEGGKIDTGEIIEVTPTPTPTPTVPVPPPGETPTPPPGETPTPTPTPTCVPEGEIYMIYLGGPECCEGLVSSGRFQIDDEGQCQPLLGGGVCTKCGLDEICGPGEDICNCPEDCEADCRVTDSYGVCGASGCLPWQRRHSIHYDPPGCGGEEISQCEFDISCIFSF